MEINTTTITVDGNELRAVAACINKSETVRTYLLGVHFNLRKEKADDQGVVDMVATNGHIIARACIDASCVEGAKLPAKGFVLPLSLVPSKASRAGESVYIEYNPDTELVTVTSGDNVQQTASAVDGRYPEYQRVLFDHTVDRSENERIDDMGLGLANLKMLMKSLQAAKVANYSGIRLVFGKDNTMPMGCKVDAIEYTIMPCRT